MTARTILVGFTAAVLLMACNAAQGGPPRPPTDVDESLVAQRIDERTAQVEEDPSSADAWGRLGTVYDLHRYFPRALTCYERASKLAPDDWRWPYFAGIVLRETDHAAAAAQFSRAAELKPDYVPLQLYIGHSLFLEEQIDPADAHYSRALELDPQSVNARIGLAQVALARQDPALAAQLLQQAVALAPQEAAVHHHMAHVHDLLGDAKAAEFARRVAASAPLAMQPGEMASFVDPARREITLRDGVSSTYLLANSRRYLAAGNTDEARRALDLLLAANPESVSGLLASARMHVASGDVENATLQIERAVNLAPGDAAVHADHGMLQARLNRLPQAIAAYRRALEIDPGLAEVQSNLATLLFQTGNNDQGLQLLGDASRQFPGRMDVQHNYANALLMLGKAGEADRLLRQAIVVDPTHAGVRHLLAVSQTLLGRKKEAIDEFSAAVALDPGNAMLRSDLALALWEARRYGEAINQYREVRAAGPNDPTAARDLAWALSVCPQAALRDGAQALKIAQQLNRQTDFGDPRFLDVLAAAQAENGDFGPAAETLGRALAIVEETMERMKNQLNPEQQQAMRLFADGLRKRRVLFQQNRPYREGG